MIHPTSPRTTIRAPVPGLRVRCVLAAVLLAACLATPTHAQVLQGRVIDGSTREPLSDARITLLHPDGRALAEPVENRADGTFILEVPGPGDYFVRVERTSYTPIVDGIFEFTGVDGRMSVEVFMLPRPVELEGIDVRVQREQERRKLRRSGFYDRAAMGFGDFVTPEKIEHIGPTVNVSDYMRGIPGLNFQGGLVLFTDRMGGLRHPVTREPMYACEPNVWVDGIRMTKATDFGFTETDLEKSLDDYMNPQDVIAMEVYRRASSTPLQWGGLGSTCGTILIWTKAGTG